MLLGQDMKLSLDQFLEHLDVEIESGLAGTIPTSQEKDKLYKFICKEEDRVAALRKDFDYKFVLTPRMMVSPMCGMFYGVGFKVEGEAERKRSGCELRVAGQKELSCKGGESAKVSPMLKFWPFYKPSSYFPKIQTTD